MAEEMRYTPDIERLLARGEECGCVEESAVDRLAESLELAPTRSRTFATGSRSAASTYEDDCGRPGVAPTSYADSDLVQHTMDTMGQFLREAARFPLLTGRRGARVGQAHRARRPRRQGQAHQPQPASGRLDRQALPGHLAHDPAGPRPGRDARADPRHREVRLAQGLPVLHLRDALDPTGDPERARQPGSDHPPASGGRDARTQDRACAPRARRPARARPDRRGDRRRRRADRRAGRRDPSGGEGRHEPRPSRRRRRRSDARRAGGRPGRRRRRGAEHQPLQGGGPQDRRRDARARAPGHPAALRHRRRSPSRRPTRRSAVDSACPPCASARSRSRRSNSSPCGASCRPSPTPRDSSSPPSSAVETQDGASAQAAYGARRTSAT